MSRDRYTDAARLLGGKYRPGIPGMKAARVWGKLEDVEYEFTWTWDVETERHGLFGRKEKRTGVRQHDYRFDCGWSAQPMTIRNSGGRVVAVPAIPGENPGLTPEQESVLSGAFIAWPGLQVTSQGYEWSATDRNDTAQQIAVTVQGLARSLQSLVPPKTSRADRVANRLRIKKNASHEPHDETS